MTRKARLQSLQYGDNAALGVRDRQLRPHKLPAVERGGTLRVGRVVSDVRNSSRLPDAPRGNQTSSPVVQEEERRVQEELLELLTTKLAAKEKESELLRCKQNAVDAEMARRDLQLQQQEQKHNQKEAELTTANQELQRQVTLLRLQCERMQSEAEVQRASALEQRRLREKEQCQVRLRDKTHQQTVDELRHEMRQKARSCSTLEAELLAAQQEQQTQMCLAAQLEMQRVELETELQASQEACQRLQESLSSEERRRKSAEELASALEREKKVLEDKHRILAKTLKDTNSRAADAEKKRGELSRVEDALTMQLTALRKENTELKARRGQMSSQTKHLQARVAALETASAAQEQKLQDATTEIDTARKYCRDLQFRHKQLQEELVFQQNRRPVAASVEEAAQTPIASPVDEAQPENASTSTTVATDEADDMPCWMKG